MLIKGEVGVEVEIYKDALSRGPERSVICIWRLCGQEPERD